VNPEFVPGSPQSAEHRAVAVIRAAPWQHAAASRSRFINHFAHQCNWSANAGRYCPSGLAQGSFGAAGTPFAVDRIRQAYASNQENIMARSHIMLALVTLFSSAPLLGASVAAAEPAGIADRPTPTAPGESTRVYRTTDGSTSPANKLTPVPNVDSPAPTTPIPMSLPDDATASEVKSEYGIGMVGLVLGTVLIALIVVSALYFITRRNWSTSHRGA
jgi:hypothetical protein